jgi:RNA polymerase sigma factor (sigma-70 family)
MQPKDIIIWQKYYKTRSYYYRDRLIRNNIRLVYDTVYKIKDKFENDIPFDEQIQIGTLGLISAVEKFNPHNGNKFSSYAVPFIRGRIKQYQRDKVRTIRVSQKQQEQVWQTKRIVQELESKGSEITWREIKARLSRSCQCDSAEELALLMEQWSRTEVAALTEQKEIAIESKRYDTPVEMPLLSIEILEHHPRIREVVIGII